MSDEDWAQVQAFHNEAAGRNQMANMQSTLQGDIALSESLQEWIAKLDKKGFDGVALQALLEQGTAEEIQWMSGQSRGDLKQLESLWEQRAASLTSAGADGAEAAFGKALRATNAEIRASTKELREVKEALGKANKRLDSLEKTQKKENPERIGELVGQAVRGAMADGRERGTRR